LTSTLIEQHADAAGDILVRPGDRIPLISRHTGRLVLDYEVNDDGTSEATSGGLRSFLHGNETTPIEREHEWPGAFIEGTDGFPLRLSICKARITSRNALNLRPSRQLFDREYATADSSPRIRQPERLFPADPNDWTNENAVSPAQPRAIWRSAGALGLTRPSAAAPRVFAFPPRALS